MPCSIYGKTTANIDSDQTHLNATEAKWPPLNLATDRKPFAEYQRESYDLKIS